MTTKHDEAYRLHQQLQGAESAFYGFFENIIEDWINVCIMEGSMDHSHHEADYEFDGVTQTIDKTEVYVFLVREWEQDWASGGQRYNSKTIHIPADFINDPTPYVTKAEETKRNREAFHENIERNRKIEQIANLSAQIDRIRATL